MTAKEEKMPQRCVNPKMPSKSRKKHKTLYTYKSVICTDMHRLVYLLLFVQAQFFTRLIRLENDNILYKRRIHGQLLKVQYIIYMIKSTN